MPWLAKSFEAAALSSVTRRPAPDGTHRAADPALTDRLPLRLRAGRRSVADPKLTSIVASPRVATSRRSRSIEPALASIDNELTFAPARVIPLSPPLTVTEMSSAGSRGRTTFQRLPPPRSNGPWSDVFTRNEVEPSPIEGGRP